MFIVQAFLFFKAVEPPRGGDSASSLGELEWESRNMNISFLRSEANWSG